MSKSDRPRHSRKRSLQVAGLLLWRAGLLLAGGTAIYNAANFLLQFIELPPQLEIGSALLITGVVFVAISFMMERYVDFRAEGDLSE